MNRKARLGIRSAAIFTLALAGSLSLLLRIAHAQTDYPNKPVRIVVDSAVGSANDASARILADELGKIWNQPVVVLNQPGAGGGISARVAAAASNDGYTLYLPATSAFLALAGGPGVAPNMPVEVPRDFTAIGFVLQQPIFIAASPKSGITSIPDLIARAKQKPNELSYASTGRGRLTHLTMELLQSRANVQLRLVPYAGGPAQAMGDVVEDRVDLVLDAYAGLAGAGQSGLIKMLASTSNQRVPGMETPPIVAETLPDFFVGAWQVLMAPVGTPDAIIRKVNADLRTAVENKEVLGKFAANGAFTRYMTPEETTAFTQDQQKIWHPILEKVARESNEGSK
ncbi:MAG TPA: tripartite tricarboxylate transporter substrate binding protein [Xanthobacteraceae bacterium]|jgi:tripartite-type tricarboxylate transporter receptor subunit TctC|nr:tripartite tricarboxylate transporter substrate binding protein [Xanthobacteraceae bacterium]